MVLLNESTKLKLKDSLPSFGVGATLLLVGSSLKNPSVLGTPCGLIGGYLVANGTLIMFQYKSKKEKKEIIGKINKLYDEFLNRYDDLVKCFDLSNPVELSAFHHYLVYNGYLSQGKTFEFEGKYGYDKFFLDKLSGGTDIITGKGVCRHISQMFTDYCNHIGINAYEIAVDLKDYNPVVNLENPSGMTREKAKEWVKTRFKNFPLTQKDLFAVFDQLSDEQIENMSLLLNPTRSNLRDHLAGNHEMCVVEQDDKKYFLDPTNNHMFIQTKDGLAYYEIVHPLKKVSTFMGSCSLKTYKKALQAIKVDKPSVSMEEAEHMIDSTKALCEDNKDILDMFYRENSDLYRDISSKMLTLKSPREIRRENR